MVRFENGNVRISVRNLVEFIMRSGDIDNRTGGKREKDAMLLGAKIHRKIQGKMGSNYHPEFPLRHRIEYDEFHITIEGRADGIIEPVNSASDSPEVIIDEIKSMYADITRMPEPVEVHKAQAMCYGYIYGIQNDLKSIGIRMTYVNIDTEDIRYFNEIYTIEELTEWFGKLINDYYKWARLVYEHTKERNKTAKALEFPFEYRAGQRQIAVSAYKSIEKGNNLFIQAPTGVGKTMSVIFPTVKAMGENIADKIFYLTAKTITGTVARQAYDILRENGLKIKSISITAKEKICPMEEKECNPVKCEYAKGHFDRVNEAMFALVKKEESITREVIMEYAQRYKVCPFELSLDVSYFADAIICDYNYAFDPTAKLKRYFSEGTKGEYVFLVDEAHNLVDRAREMYSAYLKKEDILEVKKILNGRDKRINTYLEKCNRIMLQRKRELGEKTYQVIDEINDFVLQAERLYGYLEKILEVSNEFEGRDIVLDFFFNLSNFLDVYDVLDDKYRIVSQIDDDGDFYIRLMCINPSGNLRECMDKVIATIMYSGTFLPINYYKLLLTGNTDDNAIYVDSPFDKKHRIVCIGDDVSTKYTRRGYDEYLKMAQYIYSVVEAKQGNYMVFFPSYKMMEEVRSIFFELYGHNKKYNIVSQTSGMKENEREEFLNLFEKNNDETLIALCVMGGIFSEGIDLAKERLIGTIVVGTGFPQVCMEREIVKNYFDENNMNGFDYAYRYPGMNKVLQAAGRVIRTVDDMGVIVLLDERFLSRDYNSLFPREWSDRKKTNINEICDIINNFWKK